MSTWPLMDETSKLFPLYSRANVGEIFPDPITPLNATAGFLELIDRGWRDAMVEAKVWGHDIYDPAVRHITAACFHGYLFLNMSLFRLSGVRLGLGAEIIDEQYFGEMPGIPSYAEEARPGDVDPEATAAATAHMMANVFGLTDLARWDEERRLVEDIVASRPDLGTIDDLAVLQRVVGFDDLFQRLWCSHIVASSGAGLGLGGCAQVAAAVGKPELTLSLSGGIGDVDSAGASLAMWPLSRQVRSSEHLSHLFAGDPTDLEARLRGDTHPDAVTFVADLDRFLVTWGFRGPNEWELRSETWGTKPAIALAAIGAMRLADESADPHAGEAERARQREAAAAEIRSMIAGDEAASAGFEGSMHVAHLFSRARERARMTVAMLVHEQRLAVRELGRRLAERGAIAEPVLVYMLTRGELIDHVQHGQAITAPLAEREARYQELADYIPPFVVIGEVPPRSQWARRSTTAASEPLAVGESLTGVAGSPGRITGPARLISDPSDPFAIEEGDVMVVPITDPAWTPLFLAAAGVVSDVGAPVSHAAIVSRELGIPCVVSVKDATSRIPDGSMVTTISAPVSFSASRTAATMAPRATTKKLPLTEVEMVQAI